ncbi:MAG: septum formation initiator family protein [Woeseiaceae bacterium]|nr:septum formation initiator family protein [Woeseiaceae bacterium]
MLNLRWIVLVLGMAGFAMVGQLMLSDNGFSRTEELRSAVQSQHLENESLQERNFSLEAEVLNLKNGRAAAEERARTDLGMIGKSETFYQVVPASGERLVADVRP